MVLPWVFSCVTVSCGLGLPSQVWLGWSPTCLIHRAGSGCWLLAGNSAGAVDWSTRGLGSSKHGGWVPWGCFPRVNVPGVPAGASYNLSSELPEHYFHHILLVKQVTKTNSVSRGTQPQLSLRGTSKNLRPLESDTYTCSGEPGHSGSFVKLQHKEALMIRELLIGWCGLEESQRRLLGEWINRDVKVQWS